MSEKGYKDIQRELERGVLANPLIFYGEEDFLIKWAIDRIVESYVGPSLASLNYAVLDWEESELDDLLLLWETLPMMAEKRVLVLENFTTKPRGQDDPGPEGLGGSKKTEDFLEEIKNIPDYSLLIIKDKTPDKRTKAYKALASKGGAYNFTRLKEGELRSFIVKRFNQAGKTAHSSVIRYMMEESGYLDRQSNYSLNNLENDIKKLIALSEGDTITPDHVKEGLTRNTESFVFDMIDAISAGKKGEAVTLLHSLLKGGTVWQSLLALIISSYEIMLISREMLEEGHTLADIIATTGAHEYRVKKAMALGRKYSVKKLKETLANCLKVDHEIKSGLLDWQLAMELLIINL